jgi:aminoglycoside/choline kinase family phosphotransferase
VASTPSTQPLPLLPAPRSVLTGWVDDALPLLGRQRSSRLEALGVEASGRAFYRFEAGTPPLLLMTTPPEDPTLASFLNLSTWGVAQGLALPAVQLFDLQAGRLLVDDLGRETLSDVMPQDRQRWGCAAMDALLAWQRAGQAAPPDAAGHFDQARLNLEGSLFTPWFCQGLLDTTPPDGLLEESLQTLQRPFQEGPEALVHLDWHGRNLLPQPDGSVAIVDFQDARWGPLAYDLVSFCWDAYAPWTAQHYAPWIAHYRAGAERLGLWPRGYGNQFTADFFCCGLQRALKVLGIFARLWLRDQRPTHLPYLQPVYERLLWGLGETGLAPALERWLTDVLGPRFRAWAYAKGAP